MPTNQEKIEQLNLIKQRINEGSAMVRNQIDNGALPILNEQTDSEIIKIIKDTKQFYNEGCRDTKLMVDDAIQMLTPNPIFKLPLDLTYHKTFKQVTGCLLPEALFIHTNSDQDWMDFLNWIAKNQHFNAIRCFSWGGWEPVSWPRILKPFKQLDNGKYDHTILNPEFFDMMDRRIEAAAERRITIILTMVDNCSLHINTGAWARSYFNGENNINGTSDWNNMLYHYYEPDHASKPGARETRWAIERYVRLMLQNYVVKYFPYVIAEQGNEIAAAQKYHKMYADIFNESPPANYQNFPLKFKQSSVNNQDWYKDKNLEQYYMMSIHGIGTVEDYREAVCHIAKPGKNYIFSQDGCPPTETPKETEDLTFEVLRDDQYGIEFNLRPLWEKKPSGWVKNLNNPDWSYKTLMSPPESEWFEAIKKGWQRALN